MLLIWLQIATSPTIPVSLDPFATRVDSLTDFETLLVQRAKSSSGVSQGDAEPSSGAIELNKAELVRIGHAKYANAVQIWDRKSGKLDH
ncbi:hypothetical protein QVD17_26882 [Tagetes erecta]|uniref:Uncharacterized protein n=1 Tax=Tagetes erecta TaxID=13708 RepID=A0AAD8K841_TARER|nr:hypothetical protein QVD17_26882 [Tagetes erecta]